MCSGFGFELDICCRYERQSFVSSSRMLKYLESKALAKAMLQEGAEKDPDPEVDDVRSSS